MWTGFAATISGSRGNVSQWGPTAQLQLQPYLHKSEIVWAFNKNEVFHLLLLRTEGKVILILVVTQQISRSDFAPCLGSFVSSRCFLPTLLLLVNFFTQSDTFLPLVLCYGPWPLYTHTKRGSVFHPGGWWIVALEVAPVALLNLLRRKPVIRAFWICFQSLPSV